MYATVPLKLIFVSLLDKEGVPKNHVAFYDLFGGIVEVVSADCDGLPDQVKPELTVSPINKYSNKRYEIMTLWITEAEKETIMNTIKTTFEKNDHMSAIFSGKLVSTDGPELTDTAFCVEAMRSALKILPDLPATCIMTHQFYTALKFMGGA